MYLYINNTMNKATTEELNDAMKFLKRYKSFFQLDEDDIQEIIIRFNENYDSELGGIKTFLKTVIRNYNTSKWRKAASPKYAHSEIKIDDINEDDSKEWLMSKIAAEEVNELEDEELNTYQIKIINLALNELTEKQRLVICKTYFEYKNAYEIAAEINTSYQNVYLLKCRALSRMEEFYKKNNIKMNF